MIPLSSSTLTMLAITQLTANFCEVWRQNNLSVKGRAFKGKKGVPDIIGYHKKTGITVYCEVKTITDKLSASQTDFLLAATMAGCHTFIATEINGKFTLMPFLQYNKK
jgi:hypothetical protein